MNQPNLHLTSRRLLALLVIPMLYLTVLSTRSSALESPDPQLSATAPAAVVSIHDTDGIATAGNQTCTGVLISSRHVLTAGHCMLNAWFTRVAVVVNDRGSARTYQPAAIKIIGSFSGPTTSQRDALLNDIAIITLARDVVGVSPVLLPTRQQIPTTGLAVYGWGLDGSGKNRGKIGAQTLRPIRGAPAQAKFFDAGTQFAAYGIRTTGAGDVQYEAVCGGDSGGPALQRTAGGVFTVVGIVSYGGDCRGNTPAVYSRVSMYLKWIRSIIAPVKR